LRQGKRIVPLPAGGPLGPDPLYGLPRLPRTPPTTQELLVTYKVYMTIELPERYGSKEEAMDAAVTELKDAVQRQVDMPAIEFRVIQCRVFQAGKITDGVDHDFLVDIHDGTI
jgi:hypothetical protein